MDNTKHPLIKDKTDWIKWIELVLADEAYSSEHFVEIKKYIEPNKFSTLENVFNALNTGLSEKELIIADKAAFVNAQVSVLRKYALDKEPAYKSKILITLLGLTQPIDLVNEIEDLIFQERFLSPNTDIKETKEPESGSNTPFKKNSKDDEYILHLSLMVEYIQLQNYNEPFKNYLYNFRKTKLLCYKEKESFYVVSLKYFRIKRRTSEFFEFLTFLLTADYVNDFHFKKISEDIVELGLSNSFKYLYQWFENSNITNEIFLTEVLRRIDQIYNEPSEDIYLQLFVQKLIDALGLPIRPIVILKIGTMVENSHNDNAKADAYKLLHQVLDVKPGFVYPEGSKVKIDWDKKQVSTIVELPVKSHPFLFKSKLQHLKMDFEAEFFKFIFSWVNPPIERPIENETKKPKSANVSSSYRSEGILDKMVSSLSS
jgi:hypothetical protein